MLRVVDRYDVDAGNDMVAQENHFDPRPALALPSASGCEGRPQDLVTQQDEVVVDVVDRATLCAADAERDAEVAVRVRRQRVGGHVEQVVRCGPPVED